MENHSPRNFGWLTIVTRVTSLLVSSAWAELEELENGVCRDLFLEEL